MAEAPKPDSHARQHPPLVLLGFILRFEISDLSFQTLYDPPMRILKMSPADLPDVESLTKQLGYSVSIESIKDRFDEIAKNPDFALFVAKVDGGKVVGWVQVNKGSKSLLVESYAEVAALVVDEQCRGKGIGKLLLQEAENWAKQNRMKRMSLLSNVKRSDAHRFYLREGYQISKLSNVFTKSFE